MSDTFNLGEHVGAVLIVLNLSIMVAGGLFWHMFRRMEKKIDDWGQTHSECREHQLHLFLQKKDFSEWQQGPFDEYKRGREHLWKRINQHSHRPNGKVVIGE